MADIKIDIEKLQSALTKLDALATSIDTQRSAANSNTPIDLPSLSDGTLGQTSQWLRDQKPELQTRLDLAKLLDQDGDGQASYSVEYGDELWEVKRALSTEMTDQLKNLDVDDPESRKQAELLAELLNRYQSDPDIPWQVMNALGPEGVTTVMNKLRNLTSSTSNKYYEYQYEGNPGDELQALTALQESMGKGLSLMFSSASTYMGSEWGKEIAQDPWAASVMMRYIDKANRDIDPTVFEAIGVEFKDRENNDPMIWTQLYGHPDYMNFGEQHFGDMKPMREYLNVADNSTRAAQAVMGNDDLLNYFTVERTDYDNLSDQAGKVLSAATIDAATSDNYQYGMAAAEISSKLLYNLGGDAKPLDGIKEEVGGIIATYIADADRVHSNPGDKEDGYHLWGEPPYEYSKGISDESGLPTYGINLNKDMLRGVLEDIGDNDAAKSAIGQATTIYNAARFDYAASHHDEDPTGLGKVSHSSSSFAGFMTDGLVNGNIDSAEEAAEERKKVAEFFTSPLDLIPTDKVPVIGDLVIGAAKDAIVEGYTADKSSDAISAGNDDQDASVTLTKLQGLYAMERHDVPTGVEDWPQENGRPISPDKLSYEQVQAILNQANGESGVTGEVTGEIENAWDDNIKNYGDN